MGTTPLNHTQPASQDHSQTDTFALGSLGHHEQQNQRALLSGFFHIWVTLRDEAKPRALFLFHTLSFAFPLPSGPCLLTSHIHTPPPQGPYIKQSPQTHTKSFLSGTTNVPHSHCGFF